MPKSSLQRRNSGTETLSCGFRLQPGLVLLAIYKAETQIGDVVRSKSADSMGRWPNDDEERRIAKALAERDQLKKQADDMKGWPMAGLLESEF